MDDRDHCLEVMTGLGVAFDEGNLEYIIKTIQDEQSLVLRLHAVCLLAEIGDERAIAPLSDVLLNDPDPLVRHESAFSLGQIGLTGGCSALEMALKTDSDAIVRHEAAAALGSVGNRHSKNALAEASNDEDEIVRNSAQASIFYLDFLNDSKKIGC